MRLAVPTITCMVSGFSLVGVRRILDNGRNRLMKVSFRKTLFRSIESHTALCS